MQPKNHNELRHQRPVSRPLSVDGVRSGVHGTQPLTPRPLTSSTAHQSATPRKPSPTTAKQRHSFDPPTPKPKSKATRLWERVQVPVIVSAGIIGGYLVQATWFGVGAILIYGILAIILRIPSRTTFVLAAISLGAISFMLIFRPNAELATNFSTYAFLLMCIGVLSLVLESRTPFHRNRKKGRRQR